MPYSFETSKPAQLENQAFNKRTQCDEVVAIIKRGANNLFQIHQVSGLPQSTISARMNNLIEEQRAMYEGQTVYQGRLRKKIVLLERKPLPDNLQQSSLF